MLTARATLVLAATFVLAGAAFDSPSLYVPGLALALLAASARVWVRLAGRRAELERLPGPWTIVEGDPYRLDVQIRAGPIPLPGGRVEHPLANGPAAIAGSPMRARLELRSLRRGRRDVAPATLVLADPLGLQTTEIPGRQASQVLVLPRIEPVRLREDGGGGRRDAILDGLDGLGAAGIGTRPIDFEIDGLRPYRHGSPASHIHWPTVARSGEMVEHRLVAGGDSSPLVVLDSSDATDSEALDRAVRATASLCVHLARARGCALLLSGERGARPIDPQLHAWPQAHARLAMVQGGGPRPAPQAASGDRQVIFWVTPATDPPTRPRGPAGAPCYLVGPFPVPGVETAFTVAGCHGQPLGAVRRRARAVKASAA